MASVALPIFLFVFCAAVLCVGLLVVGRFFGPRRTSPVKEMPYESGMDPIHDTRRRFDVRFYLVAIAFLIFDVELLFLYPWAVASKPSPEGARIGIEQVFESAARQDAIRKGVARAELDSFVQRRIQGGRILVFAGVAVFFVLLLLGFIYDWRKGVFLWR